MKEPVIEVGTEIRLRYDGYVYRGYVTRTEKQRDREPCGDHLGELGNAVVEIAFTSREKEE